MEPGHIEGTEAAPKHAHSGQDCRLVGTVLARIGDKWSVLVVMMLGDGPRRFNELKRHAAGATQRTLINQLRSWRSTA